MKRKPATVVHVLVDRSTTHGEAQRAAESRAGCTLEPLDSRLHDTSGSERITVEGLAMPDGMCSFVSIENAIRYKSTGGEVKYQTPAGHWSSRDGWCSTCLGHCHANEA